MAHTLRHVDISEITSVRLPGLSELSLIFSSIPNIPIELDEYWWLSTYNSSTKDALCVNSAGCIVRHNMDEKCGIRPIFNIHGEPKPFVPGIKYCLGSCKCTAIDRSHLFADDIIAYHRFYANSSIIEEYVLNALKF